MKISLRTMLIWVAFAAVVAAALARPSLLWTRLLFSCAAVFLGWSLIGALAARGRQRTFWIGAATSGIAYALLFGGGRPSPYSGDSGFELGRVLMTHQLLDWTAQAIGHNDPMEGSRATVWDPMIFWRTPLSPGPLPIPPPVAWRQSVPATVVSTTIMPNPEGNSTDYGDLTEVDETTPAPLSGSTLPPPTMPSGPVYVTPSLTPMPWTSYPAVATANFSPYTAQSTYSQFLICGHCAFLILVAAIGGAVARWKFGGEEQGSIRPLATLQ
jgi:hypothetical protein